MSTPANDAFLASPELKPRDGDLFNIDAALTEEERAVRDSVRRFVDERVLPIIGHCYVEESSRWSSFQKWASSVSSARTCRKSTAALG